MNKIQMCSGYGQFHTNEFDSDNPTKKLVPYLTIDWDQIKLMVDNPPSTVKTQAQWLIPSNLPSRNFKQQEEQGHIFYGQILMKTHP